MFRSILHERGLNLRRRPCATRTTDSHHCYRLRPMWSEPADMLWFVSPEEMTLKGFESKLVKL